MSYHMILSDGSQTGEESCFVGGKPKLPPCISVPTCDLCGADQSFFLQVAFPVDHVWSGLSIAVFMCTDCVDERYLIPEMLAGKLAGASIPESFLSGYQRNFRFVVFETNRGQVFSRYQERVRFRPIRLESARSNQNIGHVGGVPAWILDDESPGTFGSKMPMHFLVQINGDLAFETVPGAPSQMEVGLAGEPERSPYGYYQLFIGNTVYMFGTECRHPPLVYAITQVD